MAKGFTQILEQDFDENFSQAVKSTTIRLIIALAFFQNWILKKLDVKNLFLHGNPKDMEQPPGFFNLAFPHVCLLKKSIYCLKQAHHAWFDRLSKYLL